MTPETKSEEPKCAHKLKNASGEMSYVAWHDWADKKTKQGHKQRQCPKCKLWLFKCET